MEHINEILVQPERLKVGDVVKARDYDIHGVVTFVMDETGAVANPYSGRWTTGNYFQGLTRTELVLVLRPNDMHREARDALSGSR